MPSNRTVVGRLFRETGDAKLSRRCCVVRSKTARMSATKQARFRIRRQPAPEKASLLIQPAAQVGARLRPLQGRKDRAAMAE